jgi:hypothetical protein
MTSGGLFPTMSDKVSRAILLSTFFGTLLIWIGIQITLFLLADKFSIGRMTPTPDAAMILDLPSPSQNEIESVKEILKQRFIYLGKGSQCYAFQSQDGLYVLKFVRYDRLRSPFPYFLSGYKAEIRKKRQEALRESLQLAYISLKEESGLIHIHQDAAAPFQQTLLLIDKIGRNYRISCDTYGFILQKKAEPLYATLLTLKEKNQHTLASNYVKELFSLFEKRFQKGIEDLDPEIHKNSGFCDGKAMYIDIGQFKKNECAIDAEFQKRETIKMIRKLRLWSENNYSLLVEVIDRECRSDPGKQP